MATAPFRSILRHNRKPAGPWKTATTLLLMVVCLMAGEEGWAYSSESAKPARTSEPSKAASNAPRNAIQEKEKVRTDNYGDPLPDGAVARLGTVRFRHPFWVSGLAFTPDGKTLASSCWDGSVRLWDSATGKETRCFRDLSKPLPSRGPTAFDGVALSPDGKTLVALGNHEIKYVWDVASGKELHRLEGGSGFSLALSPEGKTVATGDGEGNVRLWDLKTGKRMRSFKAAARPVKALARPVVTLAFSPNSKVLAAGDSAAISAAQAADGISTVRLWDAATGRQLRELKGHTGGVTAVALSPDGKSLLSGSNDTTVLIWDVARRLEARSGLPSETQLQGFWRDLAGGDAEKADRAIHTLAATAEQSLPFLKRHVPPAKIADEERFTRLIVDLDSDQFTVRERATQELEGRGEGAETALRQALTKSPTLEARRRMENLLARLRGLPLSPDMLRSLRAVEVLEHIGTPDSLRILKSLADGAEQARLTREAKAALERLAKRRADKQ